MQPPFRLIVTEKGHEFVKDTATVLKYMQSPSSHKKNHNHLPPLPENQRYSILETFSSGNPDIPDIKSFKNKMTQSLFFYKNNQKLMNFHQQTLKDRKQKMQKPTIFSSISDPFDERKWDFHQSSINLVTRLNKRFNFNKTINSQFLNNEDKNSGSIDFTFYSPDKKLNINYQQNPENKNKAPESLISQWQKTFYTKPIVKNLNEIEILEKIQSKKLDYFQEKFRFFEDLKLLLKHKQESKEINKKSKIMEEFEEEEKRIEANLDLFKNERERFKRRLLKYNKKKFDCPNRRNLGFS